MRLDHVLSDFVHCEVGVPQGSNLGPHSLESEVDNYADDTTVTCTANTIDEIGLKLSEDCKKISEWMGSNKLKLNPGKNHC